MKKFFKFIFQAGLILIIIFAGLSYCGYHLLSDAMQKNIEKIGSQIFGGQLIINFKGQEETYDLVIKNPSGFTDGNMVLIKEITNNKTTQKIKPDNQSNNKEITITNYNIFIKNMILNYAVNSQNQINIKTALNNILRYQNQNQDAFKLLSSELLTGNKDSKMDTDKIQSITFVNPNLVLFVDDKYQNSEVMPSFSVTFDANDNSNNINILYKTTDELVKKSDALILNWLSKNQNKNQ